MICYITEVVDFPAYCKFRKQNSNKSEHYRFLDSWARSNKVGYDELFLLFLEKHFSCSAWILPAERPEGSYENHGAVQSPFHKVQSSYARYICLQMFEVYIGTSNLGFGC